MIIYVTKKGKKFWVGTNQPKKGKTFVQEEIPDLKTFLRKNQNKIQKDDFFKMISYWTYIDYHNIDETITEYGLVKRLAHEFWEKGEYLRIMRNASKSIASRMKKKLEDTKGKKPRYVRKGQHSRPR